MSRWSISAVITRSRGGSRGWVDRLEVTAQGAVGVRVQGSGLFSQGATILIKVQGLVVRT